MANSNAVRPRRRHPVSSGAADDVLGEGERYERDVLEVDQAYVAVRVIGEVALVHVRLYKYERFAGEADRSGRAVTRNAIAGLAPVLDEAKRKSMDAGVPGSCTVPKPPGSRTPEVPGNY